MPTASKSKKSRAKVTKPSVLHVGFCWDMSGSMGSIRDASIEGTRGYLADLQKEEKKIIEEHGEDVYTRLTVTAFDNVFERWIDGVPAADLNLSVLDRYQPRGGTALYDAIADTVVAMDTRVGKDEKVLVVVMTDGGENASVEYSLHNDGRKRLFDLIQSYEGRGNWTFVYLGANVDAYSEASAIGIASGNAAFYSATAASASATMGGVSNVTSTLRTSKLTRSDSSFADAGEVNDYRDTSGGTNT